MRNFLHKKALGLIIAITISMGISTAVNADGEVIPASTAPTAKASILIEASTGQVLSESSANVAMPIGTLAKLMTTLLVAEAIAAGEIALDTSVTAGSHANATTGAVIWLTVGEKMSVDNLLKGMIIGNANDAAIALAEALCGDEEAFVAKMNARAKALSMTSTTFTNCTGQGSEDQLSSAYDVALLCAELAKHTELYPYMTCWRDSLRDGATELVNANVLVKDYKGIIGMKAGFSIGAGNCLAAVATRDGLTFISVVLGCTEKAPMFAEGKALLNSGFANYKLEELNIQPEELPLIKVKGGVDIGIGVKVDSITDVVLQKDTKEVITHEIVLPEFVVAPIAEGQILGEIAFYQGKKLLCKGNLVAAGKIDSMTMGKAMGILLKNILSF